MERRWEEVKFIFTAAFIFICLGVLFYWVIFLVIAPCIFGHGKFDNGALATMMGWSATLFIGYAGYYLLDRWQVQENQKILRDEILSAAKLYFVFQQNILDLSHKQEVEKNQFNNIKDMYYQIYAQLIIIKKLSKNRIDLDSSFNELYCTWIDATSNYLDDKNINLYESNIQKLLKSFDIVIKKIIEEVEIK